MCGQQTGRHSGRATAGAIELSVVVSNNNGVYFASGAQGCAGVLRWREGIAFSSQSPKSSRPRPITVYKANNRLLTHPSNPTRTQINTDRARRDGQAQDSHPGRTGSRRQKGNWVCEGVAWPVATPFGPHAPPPQLREGPVVALRVCSAHTRALAHYLYISWPLRASAGAATRYRRQTGSCQQMACAYCVTAVTRTAPASPVESSCKPQPTRHNYPSTAAHPPPHTLHPDDRRPPGSWHQLCPALFCSASPAPGA